MIISEVCISRHAIDSKKVIQKIIDERADGGRRYLVINSSRTIRTPSFHPTFYPLVKSGDKMCFQELLLALNGGYG